MPPPVERRRHPRFLLGVPVGLTAVGERDPDVAGELADLSVGGCYFRALVGRPIGRATISFIAGSPAPFASGRIVRHVSGHGFAVAFDSIAPDLTRLVSGLGMMSPSLRSHVVSGFLRPVVELELDLSNQP